MAGKTDNSLLLVSTHSRPKAAGEVRHEISRVMAFQHTAARRRLDGKLKAAKSKDGFNTQPPEGGWFYPFVNPFRCISSRFQHTAARRRLVTT